MNPSERMTSAECLAHPFFAGLVSQPYVPSARVQMMHSHRSPAGVEYSPTCSGASAASHLHVDVHAASGMQRQIMASDSHAMTAFKAMSSHGMACEVRQPQAHCSLWKGFGLSNLEKALEQTPD
jgi:hypothetical protein